MLSPEQLADEILAKIQAHKDFCKKLFAMAESGEIAPIQINSRHCGLGVLMTTSMPPIGYENWWEKIHEVHDQYHAMGAKIIQVLKDPNKGIDMKRREAHELANKGKALSEVVIGLMESAAAEIRNAKPRERRAKKVSLP